MTSDNDMASWHASAKSGRGELASTSSSTSTPSAVYPLAPTGNGLVAPTGAGPDGEHAA
jgi:hypothetical protein